MDIRNAVATHRALVARLREAFPEADEQTIADTAEGETTLDQAIGWLLRMCRYDEENAKALAEIIRDNQERKRRLEWRADKLKALALWACQEAGIKSILTPDMTATVITPKTGRVIITDESKLPEELVKVERTAKRKDIADRLIKGEDVPGAEFGNPIPYLMARWK